MDSRRALAIALSLLGFAFRLFALVLCALTVVLCFGFATMLGIVNRVSTSPGRFRMSSRAMV